MMRILSIVLLGWAVGVCADPLEGWRTGVKVRAVTEAPGRHTIHSYYLANPESPDGSKVLFFVSTEARGEFGELHVLDRKTGAETVVAKNVTCEDAHRAACQQWTLHGKAVAYHDLRDGKWGVYVVGPEGEKTIALDRQLSFGQAAGNLLPVYGKHWNPGEHRHLELADAASGKIEKVLDVSAVKETYGEWVEKQFKGKDVSIFFPIVSPDQKRVFFKMAAGNGGDTHKGKVSDRQGLVVFDLEKKSLLCMKERWGHPAWFPDSRQIIEVGNFSYDCDEKGKANRILGLPVLNGCHLAVSPDGSVFVQDGELTKLGGKPGEWGVVVCDVKGGEGRYQILHRFNNSRGAKTWRHNHPHPVFSSDGKRIYFNVNETEWTQLFVAERG